MSNIRKKIGAKPGGNNYIVNELALDTVCVSVTSEAYITYGRK